MYELKNIKGNSYYIASPSNVGLYVDGSDAYLIDSGNDKSAAKKILDTLNEHDWNLKMIINTHFHADHTGGNAYLLRHTDAVVYAHPQEIPYITNPELEFISMWGGVIIESLVNKHVEAAPTPSDRIVTELPADLFEIIDLKGHTPNQIGLKTKDNVLFVGDAVSGEYVINKFNVCYIYDVEEYLETLKRLSTTKCDYYLAAHAPLTNDISELVKINTNKTLEIAKLLTDSCQTPKTIEELVKVLFDTYQIPTTPTQYTLIASTIKGHLKYLLNKNLLKIEYNDGYQTILINE